MTGLPPLRWAVLTVDLDPTTGHEQGRRRRALVVSYEAFHRSGLATICPISAARVIPRYPNEVPIPVGEAGQSRDGVILCHQVRTISLGRVQGLLRSESRIKYVLDPNIRSGVRTALAHQCGLDIPEVLDGVIQPDNEC